MANANYGAYQLSYKTGNGHMLNCAADNKEEFKQRILDTLEMAKLIEDKLAEKPMVDISNYPLPKDDFPVTSYEKGEPVNACSHKNTREISGVGQYGPWAGITCKDCGMANFQRKKKNPNDPITWQGWKAKDSK